MSQGTAKNPALTDTELRATPVPVDASSAAVPVTDNSGSLTVDNNGTFAVQAAQSGTWNVGTVTPGAGASNLGKAEDAAHTSGDVGVMSLAVRQDTATQLAGTDGDYSPLITDANGRLHVVLPTGSTGLTDTELRASPVPVSLTSTTITGTVAVTQSGTWDEVGINDSGNSITVDNGGTFAVQVDGAALTALQLLDDTVATLGTTTYTEASTKGNVIGAVRRDADTTLVDTTNEIGPLQMDANGRLKVEAFSGETLPVSLTSTTITGTVAVTQSGTWDEVGINDSGNSITVDNGGTFAVQATVAAGATNIAKAEDVASADADVGVPAMAVRKATPANTSDTDGDYEMLQMSAGRLWVDPSGVTLTVASHAVTNAGTFVVQENGAALTSLQLIDDAIFAEDVAASAADKGIAVLAVRRDANTTMAGTDNDYANLQVNPIGQLKVVDSASPSISNYQVSVDTTSGGVTMAPGTPLPSTAVRKRIIIVNHGTTDVYIGSGTVTTSNGLLLIGIKGAALTLETTATIKGIVASGSQTVSCIEEYTS